MVPVLTVAADVCVENHFFLRLMSTFIWEWSRPCFRPQPQIFSGNKLRMQKIGPSFPFPGFTLHNSDQKFTFYIILWENEKERGVEFDYFPQTSNKQQRFIVTFSIHKKNQIDSESHTLPCTQPKSIKRGRWLLTVFLGSRAMNICRPLSIWSID